ncbi:nitrate/nitrite transporter [Paenibacillus sp. J22TS3]|uniref:MFS transporter n=1 Tax=Paenibacillus sp. J22TS3 TaxID=2807192 RepID=UPI001B124A01|nr:MFS transporter [Paenibacillus sp. J22TS3]GIP22123.1 MFS transporter [Paenibacillus sp. J22TS3]
MTSSTRKWVTLFVLAFSGGLIYQLPYLREQFYIPMQNAFHINNTQLGNLMTIYGIINFFLYLPGGLLADKFSYKLLVPFSLILTGITGFYYSTFPAYHMALTVHVIWAFTTVFTFWPTMLKAVKMLGESSEQGRLFGFLDGGRGLSATLSAFAALWIFKAFGATSLGLRGAILFYSVALIVLGIAAYFLLDNKKSEEESSGKLFEGIVDVLKMPSIWLAAIIIFTGYSINAGLTYVTPYLTDVFHMSVSVGAFIGIIRTYGLRLGGGPLGGIIADRMGSATRYIRIGFVAVILLMALFTIIPGNPSYLVIMLVNMLVVSLLVFTIKGVYFAPLDEIKVPNSLAGAAYGAISLVGYLPDTFIYTYFGNLLDKNPGTPGYKYIFLSLIVLAVIGFLASFLLYKRLKKQKTQAPARIDSLAS